MPATTESLSLACHEFVMALVRRYFNRSDTSRGSPLHLRR
jgi:hypothetical protein